MSVMATSKGKDEIITLNVGGKKFTVRRSDLTADPRSRLAEWFKMGAARPVPVDKQGNYFLDRDGKVFRRVLQYLRARRERVVSPMMTLPMKPDQLAMLLAEAETLGLEDLRNDCLDLLQCYLREEMGHAVAYTTRVVHLYDDFQYDNRSGLPAVSRGRQSKKPMPVMPHMDSYDDWDA